MIRTAALLMLAASPASAGGLTVDVSGATPGGGTVYVALCRGGLNRTACAPGDARPARAETVRLTIDDVAPGTYAVVAFQDADGDGRLKRSLIGRPREPYAISNAPKGLPLFKKAAFTVGDAPARIEIRLKAP